MAAARFVERTLLAVLVIGTGWQTLRVARLERQLDNTHEAFTQLLDAQKAAREATEARLAALAAPRAADLFGGGGAPAPQAVEGPASRGAGGTPSRMPATAPGAAAGPAPAPAPRPRRTRMPDMPGTNVLNRLYDAADAMAADEQWDARTYDDVAFVFEDTAAAMQGVLMDLKDGRITPIDARDEALALRDGAQDELARILGDDGVEVLKGYLRDDRPPRRR